MARKPRGEVPVEALTEEEIGDADDIQDSYDELDESLQVKYSISSYGADYPVDSLVKRINTGDIYVPDFQRGYVWPLPKASRFIESLLLGLPVPGIFLSAEGDTRRLLVIDGQQRLWTLQYFYKGIVRERNQAFFLTGLKSPFDGITYERLSAEDRRRLDDSIIHATIVRQDQPSDDDSSIYQIFERLNTGGVLLAPQEIRACIYHGAFNDLLHELNQVPAWREIFGPTSRRMRDQELILRFFALVEWRHQYERPMKDFLNRFMGSHRTLDDDAAEAFTKKFNQTIATLYDALGKGAFRPVRALNAAVYDAVMVGIATRLARGGIKESGKASDRYAALIKDQQFDQWTRSRTTDETILQGRLDLAIKAFSDVP
jgi:hypothetical protein